MVSVGYRWDLALEELFIISWWHLWEDVSAPRLDAQACIGFSTWLQQERKEIYRLSSSAKTDVPSPAF